MHNNLIIFDIDGTLTDSVTVHQEAYRRSIADIGIQAPEAGFGEFKHHTDKYIFKELFADNKGFYPENVHFKEFYKRVNHHFDHLISETPLEEIKGATHFIKETLDKNNIPYVFATGSILNPAIKKLDVLKLESMNRLISSSNDFYTREEIVLNSVELAKKHYKKTIFNRNIVIGDGKWDYYTAMNLDYEFLGIGDNQSLLEILKENKQCIWQDFYGKSVEDFFSNTYKNNFE